MYILYTGVILGVITYISFMGYYWIYLPTKIRLWFQRSMARLFILDATLTVVGYVGFSGVTDSLIGLVGSATLGLLATITTLSIITCQQIRSLIKPRQ